MNPAKTLLLAINQRFIDDVGPIGDLLIDDAKRAWREQNWRGPVAFRHYIKNLASNIENNHCQQRFLDDAGQLLLHAQNRAAS